jgi:hypothetical protein
MEKKRKSMTNHRKKEKKEKFECPRNVWLMFQKEYPNHAWTPLTKKLVISM